MTSIAVCAVAREHNYCFDRKILVGTPILLVLVSLPITVSIYKMW